MKIYGENFFRYPGTNRVVWDFEDGPFETMNPYLIEAAKKLGYRLGEPPAPVVIEPPKAEEVKAEKVVKKAGRPRSTK